jgi:hypothetical protein
MPICDNALDKRTLRSMERRRFQTLVPDGEIVSRITTRLYSRNSQEQPSLLLFPWWESGPYGDANSKAGGVTPGHCRFGTRQRPVLSPRAVTVWSSRAGGAWFAFRPLHREFVPLGFGSEVALERRVSVSCWAPGQCPLGDVLSEMYPRLV